jgi:hypothetical protein
MTFEEDLARQFGPTYISSTGEHQYLVELEPDPFPKISTCFPPWKPCIYYSIFKWPKIDDHDFYEINYLSIWDWDTGLFGHMWDTERTGLLVKGPAGGTNSSSFRAQEAYYAAHEGVVILNRSKYVELSGNEVGVTVYWSRKKHASYPSYEDLKEEWFEDFKKPGDKADPTKYSLKNAGTVDSPCFPWIKYKEPWGPDRISSIYSKLKDRIWSPVPGSSRWQRNLPGEKESRDEVKKFQRALRLGATGKFNKELRDLILVLPREVIMNTSMMDEDLLAKVVKLQLKKLNYGQIVPTLEEIPPEYSTAPKPVEGLIGDIAGTKAAILGKLNSKTLVYGMMNPVDKKIFDVRAAPIETIEKTKIRSSDLYNLGK